MDLSIVRRRLEEGEQALSPYAVRSDQTRGRRIPEEPSPVRTEFQRDREGSSLQGIQASKAQDTSVHCASGRSLRDQVDSYTGGLTDRADDRTRPESERRPRRS